MLPSLLLARPLRGRILRRPLLLVFLTLLSMGRADVLISTQTFTSPGTGSYTLPATATRVEVEVKGAGGTGSGSEEEYSRGGSGGAASASYFVTDGQVVNVEVGEAGNGGNSQATGAGGFFVLGEGGGSGEWIEGGGIEGRQGEGYFDPAHGYLASSGWTSRGGGSAGGTYGFGDHGSVVLRIYTSDPPTITSATTVNGPVGAPVTFQITGTNYPRSYGASGLPAGLSVNSSTGVISGTLGATGTFSFTVSATNPIGTGQATVTWSAHAAPAASAPSAIHAKGFTANWTAATGVSGYLLDVSTNSAFTSFLSGYGSLAVGNVLSRAVATAGGATYYYRVRAIYAVGASLNSNVISAGTTNGTYLALQTYTTPGTFSYTIPANATLVAISVNGAGGRGNSGEEWASGGGAGGYGGATYGVAPGQVISIVVGAGSGGGSSASITGGLFVSASGGGDGDEYGEGSPGGGSYNTPSGYFFGSGVALGGNGGAGGWPGEHGADGSVGFWVHIGHVSPSILIQPQSQTAVAGTGVTLTVTVAGYPAPNVFQWRKNGAVISGATAATLAFPSVQSADAGSYAVTIASSIGSLVSTTATLTVADSPPTAPTALNYAERTATTVTLLWLPAIDNIGVTAYHVYRAGTLIGTTADVVYADSGLTASTAYAYTVKAADTAGQLSAASATLNVTTTQDYSADTDGDGIPNATETALGTNGSSAANRDTTNQTLQNIHRPKQ